MREPWRRMPPRALAVSLAWPSASTPGAGKYEALYIRPANGRATDQLRGNHSTQYISTPDWPWERLRKESPGVYESYADMVAGEWTRLRIAVHGTEAELYVGGAQPSLLLHDLKLGDSTGNVGLWIGSGTEGYFNSRVSKSIRFNSVSVLSCRCRCDSGGPGNEYFQRRCRRCGWRHGESGLRKSQRVRALRR